MTQYQGSHAQKSGTTETWKRLTTPRSGQKSGTTERGKGSPHPGLDTKWTQIEHQSKAEYVRYSR